MEGESKKKEGYLKRKTLKNEVDLCFCMSYFLLFLE